MTIERVEFGLLFPIVKKPKSVEVVPPGTTEIVQRYPNRPFPGIPAVQTITTESSDEATVTWRGVYSRVSRTYVRDEINKARIIGKGPERITRRKRPFFLSGPVFVYRWQPTEEGAVRAKL